MLLIQPTVGRERARFPGVGVDNVDLGKLPGSSEATVVMGHDQLLEPPNIWGVEKESIHLATLKIVLKGLHEKQCIVRDRVLNYPQGLGQKEIQLVCKESLNREKTVSQSCTHSA